MEETEKKNRDSSVGIATGHWLDKRGLRVRFPAGLVIFLFTTASRPALGPTEPPIQWVPGALSPGVKRPWHEADHSPLSSAEVKECVELHFHLRTRFMAWCLVKQRDNFTFTLLDGGEWSVTRPGRFIPGEGGAGTHWIWGWLGPRASPEAVTKGKISLHCPYRGIRTPVVQPVT
jgi:hypothetical protein